MENLIIAIFIYVAAVAIAYCPKSCKVEPVEKIEYFPEIEMQLVNLQDTDKKTYLVNLPDTEKKPHLANLPVRGYESSFVSSQNSTAIPHVIATVTPSPVTDLKTLTAKELKAIARNQKVHRYGSLTKKQLLMALT
jgi:hypothetical protein